MSILSTELAQDIVTRTMKIIPYNVNVMDVSGSIIASGNPGRIGELHTGAMLALAKAPRTRIQKIFFTTIPLDRAPLGLAHRQVDP